MIASDYRQVFAGAGLCHSAEEHTRAANGAGITFRNDDRDMSTPALVDVSFEQRERRSLSAEIVFTLKFISMFRNQC